MPVKEFAEGEEQKEHFAPPKKSKKVKALKAQEKKSGGFMAFFGFGSKPK